MTDRIVTLGFAVGLAIAAFAPPVVAQSAGTTTVDGRVGFGLRGTGNLATCCGPLAGAVQTPRPPSIGFGGGVAHWFSDRVAVAGDASWFGEPTYQGFVQRLVAAQTHALFASVNQVSTVTVVGLVRLRAAQSPRIAVDIVAGGGWAAQLGKSWMARTGPIDPQTARRDLVVADVVDDRHGSGTAIAGADFATPAFGSRTAVVTSVRLQQLLRSADPSRGDLTLGDTVWSVSAGLRGSFGGPPTQRGDRPTPGSAPSPHRFLDALNLSLTAGEATALLADGITTQMAFARYGPIDERDPIARPFVVRGWPGQVAGAGIFLAADAALRYVLHKKQHHLAERLLPLVLVTYGTVCAAHNGVWLRQLDEEGVPRWGAATR